MMFYGADLEITPEKHKEKIIYFDPQVNKDGYKLRGGIYTPEMADEIDYRFRMLEEIWANFSKDKNKYLVKLIRDPSDNNGEVHNWSSLRGDPHLTAATTDPGPMKGEVHWKFPTPHLWLTRPAFDEGRVYVGSPGVSYLAYCIDAKTGEYIWKSIPEGNGLRTRYYGPRASSPVLVAGDNIIFRRIQVNGFLEHFIFINKETGIQNKGIKNNEFLNSSSGYAPFDGNENYLVYPQGIQPVVQQEQKLYVDQLEYRKQREDFPFDSLACKSTRTGKLLWRKYMGEFYAEPLLSGNQVFAGNTAGDFRCYNVKNGDLLWEVKTGASINARAAANDELVLIGNEAGKVFAFNKNTGEEAWSSQLQTVPAAFQVFSSFTIAGENSYLGSADKNVYCFETKTGAQKWKFCTDDWVRSAPLAMGDNLYVASLGGKMFCIGTREDKPVKKWEKVVSEFPILADLAEYGGDIFFTTTDFYLVSVDPNSGSINWKTSTFERMTDKEGNTILGDITGQPDEQSSVIAVDGKAYFGMPGFVYCVDIETGKRIWRFEDRGQFTGAPYISNGKLFIGQRGGTPYFYCLNAATGEMIWKKRFGHVWASANGLDGKVYLNSEGGTFYCVDEDTGDVIWQYQAGLGLSYNTPGFYKNLVYFGANHHYYAFDQHSGELIWKFSIGDGKTDSGNPLIENGVFYCGGMFGGRYSAVNALTGEAIWILDNVGSNTSPTTDGTNLIVNTAGVAFTTNPLTVALDLKTGEIKYTLPFGGLSGPALGNNLVFMATRHDPYFRAWDVRTGEIRWVYRMGGRGAESCTTIYGDKAFFLADDSYAYCFK
jgi:outer membrane protein assembly factor BamB